jgi:trimethylamine---corrinoid protein Co-methyltransferase
LPPDTRQLDYLYAALRYSDKPLAVMTLDAAGAADALALAGLVFGEKVGTSGRCLVFGTVNVDSPLRFGGETLRAMLAFARAGQPLLVTPFILPGVLSPATPAGALAQQNAENLAALVLAQTQRPGTPVVYGSFATEADMRYAKPLFGGGEAALLEVAAGQLAGRYGLPHRGMGLVTTAQAPDAQAAWEKMSCLGALASSNAHLLLHAAGWLEGGLTASFEQFVLDLEMLASQLRYMGGLRVDEQALGLDAIAEVGPGGSYLLAPHTLANYRDTCHLNTLVDGRPYDNWLDGGATGLLERSRVVWQRCLEQYEEPPLEPGLHEAIREYVARRKGIPANASRESSF